MSSLFEIFVEFEIFADFEILVVLRSLSSRFEIFDEQVVPKLILKPSTSIQVIPEASSSSTLLLSSLELSDTQVYEP